jgi:hypothetical protein
MVKRVAEYRERKILYDKARKLWNVHIYALFGNPRAPMVLLLGARQREDRISNERILSQFLSNGSRCAIMSTSLRTEALFASDLLWVGKFVEHNKF